VASSPFPWDYHNKCPHYRVAAVLPQSPSPCQSLILTPICNTTTTLSADCPTMAGMTITPSIELYKAGDVLTCGSDGYDPTYTWNGVAATGTTNQVTVVDSPNPYTVPAGPFSLTCTAEVTQLDCTATITITETAYSKYQKQCNTLVRMPMLVTPFVGVLPYCYCVRCLFRQ